LIGEFISTIDHDFRAKLHLVAESHRHKRPDMRQWLWKL
jgi:hypothetical protein